MNHFADDAETRRLDQLALDAIQTLDPVQVYETVKEERISMCGASPCTVVMEALRCLKALHRCRARWPHHQRREDREHPTGGGLRRPVVRMSREGKKGKKGTGTFFGRHVGALRERADGRKMSQSPIHAELRTESEFHGRRRGVSARI